MTERLADVSARIDGIRQLGAVVNAMKGIAAARARTARTQIDAVNRYATILSTAMSCVLDPDDTAPAKPTPGKTGLLVFLAEQGFAGAFSERVLDSIGGTSALSPLFLVGTRGLSVALTRDIQPIWTAGMPSHTPGIPKLADRITRAVYHAIEDGRIESLDVIHAGWTSGRPQVERHPLVPIDRTDFPARPMERPMTQLARDTLLASLGADYLYAQICKAALHAFAAENEARMEAMSAAGTQIARELATFQSVLRRVRQEAITAEIIELGTGAATARDAR